MTRFDKIISLGEKCKVAFQLERLGLRESCVFDWLITPWDGLTSYLGEDFAGFLDRDRLTVGPGGEGVVDVTTGARFLHDFSTEPTGSTTEALIDEDLPRVRQKYEHLLGKWRQLSGFERLMFVRAEEMTTGDASDLLAKLRGRFPAAEVQLLIVQHRHASDDAAVEGVTRMRVIDDVGPAPEFWKGSDAVWDGLASELGLEVRPSGEPSLAYGW